MEKYQKITMRPSCQPAQRPESTYPSPQLSMEVIYERKYAQRASELLLAIQHYTQIIEILSQWKDLPAERSYQDVSINQHLEQMHGLVASLADLVADHHDRLQRKKRLSVVVEEEEAQAQAKAKAEAERAAAQASQEVVGSAVSTDSTADLTLEGTEPLSSPRSMGLSSADVLREVLGVVAEPLNYPGLPGLQDPGARVAWIDASGQLHEPTCPDSNYPGPCLPVPSEKDKDHDPDSDPNI